MKFSNFNNFVQQLVYIGVIDAAFPNLLARPTPLLSFWLILFKICESCQKLVGHILTFKYAPEIHIVHVNETL